LAGRPPEVDHVKATFLKGLSAANDLVTRVKPFAGGINPNGAPGINPKHVRQVVELAFMGIVASWEEFLEMSLVRYVAGAKTKAGYQPVAKFGRANSLEHAYQILSGVPKFNPKTDYLKVSDPKWVTNSADFIFSSHGFTEVRTKSDLLGFASKLRNRVAHSSDKCRADFKATALHFLPAGTLKLTQGYGVGDLLLATATRHFGPIVNTSGVSHFKAYVDVYTALAQKIVP
jgi:hypothetical protein